jgi:hypothetical protein
MVIDQLLNIMHISIWVKRRPCDIIIIFYSQLLHAILIQNSYIVQDDDTVDNVFQIHYTSLPSRSFDNSELCLKHTKSMLHILSILTLLNCEILLLRALRPLDVTDQSSPKRINTIGKVISHIVLPIIDNVSHLMSNTLS